MKDILIITSYYPPEIGAASNRIAHLAEGLKDKKFNVSILTPLPNYPTGKIFKAYKGHFKLTTIEKGTTVNRLWIYASNSKNKLLRLIAMFSYSFSLLWFFTFNKIPQKVIVQSPPLLVAFTCMLFLKSKKRKLILNVSDLWPIAGLELGALKKNFSYSILEKIEHFNYKKADLILGQSEEILTHVTSIYPDKATFLYRNYPEIKNEDLNFKATPEGKIKMVYAGLLGIAQGIYELCNRLNYDYIEFHIYGSGSEQEKIENYITNNPQLPITFHGQVSRNELHEVLKQYDITIIPLLNRIYGSVPSKIFEYAKLGLPMLYFGGGEGENIIRNNNLGWIAKSGDYNDLNRVISSIDKQNLNTELNNAIKTIAYTRFDLKNQLDNLALKLSN
ncbi:glycosyltransferase (GT4) [Formosa agariphila KMM 3901]|uniref:Glycosyltransferase (GT4) n=1 Tax=Formosa agariphila (strain DSM 15362 / KCTC 12365 / LMG 23005 / KMM 3901 / M-2Alg 35-1) TaxID=1347342 RepID=T2KRS1_FORAG|nr:glycosyltransferase family 4 protein [Formosa agariphila]CDF81213.1 glycosyltransferase (GT4) [Formosa agariphila KMM 3901]